MNESSKVFRAYKGFKALRLRGLRRFFQGSSNERLRAEGASKLEILGRGCWRFRGFGA